MDGAIGLEYGAMCGSDSCFFDTENGKSGYGVSAFSPIHTLQAVAVPQSLGGPHERRAPGVSSS